MKRLVVLSIISLLLSACGSGTTSTSTPTSISPSSDPSTSIDVTSEESTTENTSQKEKLPAIDYIKVFSPKTYTNIYAWDGDNKIFGKWPGTSLANYDNNWNYKDIKGYNNINVIFNDGSKQTKDKSIIGYGYYFYIDDEFIKSEYYIDPNEELISEDISEEPVSHDTETTDLYKNYYQLLVYSFADSNGDGMGDFKGIANQLDYLKRLGIEAIWLSPINKASSYHSYDVTDYYSVNPLYEVNDYDLQDLVMAAHNKGIKIILDLVLNHTSKEHPWCKEHRSWYGSDDKFGMPEFNFDVPEVREEMKQIGYHWLNKGVDGFRLDAAMWIYNYNNNKNYTWWNEWCSAMRSHKENVYIVAEVLDSNHDLAYEYARGGFNSTFDFNAMEHVYKAVNNPSYDYAGHTIVDINKAKNINSDYILARALSNHDIGRFSDIHNDMGDAKAYYINNDIPSYKLAMGLNIMTPGNTFIYYGDELGLKGTCPNGYDDMSYRTPMPFENGRTDSLVYYKKYHTDTQGYTTSVTASGKSVEQDMITNGSIYAYMSELLNLKKNHPTIKSGIINKISGLENNLNGYKIVGEEEIYVIYNASSSSITHNFTGDILFINGERPLLANGSISIPSKGMIVYSK